MSEVPLYGDPRGGGQFYMREVHLYIARRVVLTIDDL